LTPRSAMTVSAMSSSPKAEVDRPAVASGDTAVSTLRVLYDHQVFSRQSAGGASRYFCELVRQLSHAPNVELDLLVGASASVYALRELSSASARVRAFRAPMLPGIGNYALNEALGNCLAPLLGKADVYHPTLYRIMPGVKARRVVATHHDCTYERYPRQFRYVDKVMRAKRSQYARADAIICVSEWARTELLDIYGVERSKTRVIYHGLTRLPLRAESLAQVRQIVRRDFLLYVGSRAPYKNFHGLLTAFAETGLDRAFDLLAVGGGPLSRAEQARITKLGINHCVFVAPAAADELLAGAYAAATLFVYPSLSEGFGLPPLEAMSLACPVLASRVSSIPEVCGDAPFYFDPADQGSFHRELLRAVSDEAARRQSIDRGEEVIGRYSWEKCGRETLALYRACQ
jgi:glycosyltransferase involved in cell wall biosynthesis